jgi:hypothetical protein
VAEDLGTWPPEQATVLVDALQQAGLAPEAKRTREGILVTVPDEQSDEAHRTLVANMDAIARAARPHAAPGGGRRRRPRPAPQRQAAPEEADGALASERMLRLARPLGLLLVVLLLAWIRVPVIVIVLAVAVVVYLLGKQAQQRGEDDEDRRR